jgi:hypothetical protein
MRYFLSKQHPDVSRILLVESGSRHLLERLVPLLRQQYGEDVPIDLATCYAGLPAGLPPESSTVYHVSNYRGRTGRKRLYRELRSRPPSILVVVCSGEPIMTKWKWVLAARLPAKVLVLNENGDYFWLDRGNWRIVRHFVAYRAGLSGAEAVRTITRVVLFPFTFVYLLLYAAAIHLRRKVQG